MRMRVEVRVRVSSESQSEGGSRRVSGNNLNVKSDDFKIINEDEDEDEEDIDYWRRNLKANKKRNSNKEIRKGTTRGGEIRTIA